MKKRFFFLLLLGLFSVPVIAQNLRFPYDVQIETIKGICFDDCGIIITLKDKKGNVIKVDPHTHHTVDSVSYPLYNIQFHYRNQKSSTNTRYDSIGDIQLSAGTYCVGILGYVPITVDGVLDYVRVDTTICNVEVPTDYVHLEASSLLSIAGNNDYRNREYCGLRPAHECGDNGRIQLLIRKGRFPYRVAIIGRQKDTVRVDTFPFRQNLGLDPVFADYQDYFTFDNMKAGDYSIVVSDSCEYSICLSVTVPLEQKDGPYLYCHTSTVNNCADTNVISFAHYIYWQNNFFFNYHYDYLDSLIDYRFINPGGDTTCWYHQRGSSMNGYLNTYDTIRSISKLCDIYEDTIIYQVYDKCRDQIYSQAFCFHKQYPDLREAFAENVKDLIIEPDTCFISRKDGKSSQSYFILGNYIYDYYASGVDVGSQLYTCPFTLKIYAEDDTTLLVQDVKNNYRDLYAELHYEKDTTIKVHIVVQDNNGCEIIDKERTFDFLCKNIEDTVKYTWTTAGNFPSCCWNRYVYIQENDVDYGQFRFQDTISLIESPLYNKYNFTAVNDYGVWSSRFDDTTLTSAQILVENGSRVRLTADCLPPGRYKFRCTTECGTFENEYVTSGIYREELIFEQLPKYETEQICDRYFVKPHSALGKVNRYRIDPNISNDEPLTDSYNTDVSYSIYQGVVGGYSSYRDEQGRFVFTIPGDYVIQSYFGGNCETQYHYDTIHYVPHYIDFDMAYAVVCDGDANTGSVITHAHNGVAPYTYYLYDLADLEGNVVAANQTGLFYDVPLIEGQKVSVLVVDSCGNSFSINVVATTVDQSMLAWDASDNLQDGYCEGDSVQVEALKFTREVNYLWTGPNGFSSTERVNTIYLPYGSESGWYVVQILNTGCKNRISDSVYVKVFQAPQVELLQDTTVCPGTEVALAIAVRGNGLVQYDLNSKGAPLSTSESCSTPSGDTIFKPFLILSDNFFWATDIRDERCRYHYTSDSVQVSIFGVNAAADSANIETIDGEACYNYEAVLQAKANYDVPYVVSWYKSKMQENLLQQDTIFDEFSYSQYSIPHLLADTFLYVTVSSNGHCADFYGAIYHWILMHNGMTLLQGGEGARFFDSGGDNQNYSNEEHLTHTFCCPDRDELQLIFRELEIAVGDTLYIYAGNEPNSSNLVKVITNSNYPSQLVIPGSDVTFVFSSNWINNMKGWIIDILTDIEMKKVYAHLIPPTYDTVYVEACQSTEPYSLDKFMNIDVSQVGSYQIDSVFVSSLGCDSFVTLNIQVHPIQENNIVEMVCDSFVWNDEVYTESGSYSQTLQTIHGCDSTVYLDLTVLNLEAEIIQLDDFCDDYKSELSVTSNAVDFLWNTGEQTQNIIVTKPGNYSVIATDRGCEVNADIDIERCELRIFLPNAITANGDGLNDDFHLTPNVQSQLEHVEIYIYNRWGQQVFFSDDIYFKWDGSYKGKIFHDTVYTYQLRCVPKDGPIEYFTGSITVL